MIENKVEVGGIKCDAEGCDYTDENVNLEDYNDYLNKPCPKCGANLLTQEDMDTVQYMIKMVNFLNDAGIMAESEDDQIDVEVKMNGTGGVEFEEIK